MSLSMDSSRWSASSSFCTVRMRLDSRTILRLISGVTCCLPFRSGGIRFATTGGIAAFIFSMRSICAGTAMWVPSPWPSSPSDGSITSVEMSSGSSTGTSCSAISVFSIRSGGRGISSDARSLMDSYMPR